MTEWEIHLGAFGDAGQVGEADVLNHADDLIGVVATAGTDAFADRGVVGPKPCGELSTDDDGGEVAIVGGGKGATGDEGDLHDAEVVFVDDAPGGLDRVFGS